MSPEEWQGSAALFATLPGATELIAWFGFVPSFHDATLAGLVIRNEAVTIEIDAFRMTDEVDPAGYFVLDRHARVTLQMVDVTGLSLKGSAVSILRHLLIRKVDEAPGGYVTCPGPQTGDYEVTFETSYGLEGSIFARDVSLSLRPAAG